MNIEERLTGGHPNSLGNTIEVVEDVLESPELFEELFNCYFSADEVVRLRVSNALKRICKARKPLILPYINRLINEISKIDQASTKWTMANLFEMLEKEMTDDQIVQAKGIMKSNLESEDDWIVLNMTMQCLAKWSKKDDELKEWLLPHLERLKDDGRKSVSAKARKSINLLF